MQDCFSEVYTNPAQFLGGALRVKPYHAKPPGCHRLCPVNLCKGQVGVFANEADGAVDFSPGAAARVSQGLVVLHPGGMAHLVTA